MPVASAHHTPPEPVKVGPVEVRLDEYKVLVDGRPLWLTRRELQVLTLLAIAQRQTVRRDAIYGTVWGQPTPGQRDRSVEVYIGRLRKKLAAVAPRWSWIDTHHHVGYRLDPRPRGDTQ